MMVRIVMFSVALVVGLTPGLSSGMEQTQGTQMQVHDQTWLQQGCQAADVIQNLAVATGQDLNGAASQSLLANMGGTANAASEGAEIGVLRQLDATAWQGQIVTGPCHPKREDQNLDLGSLLSVGMNNGPGEGHALQQSVLRQDQGEGNFMGVGTASAVTLALQTADLAGFAVALDGVETRMQVQTVQNQVSQ
jgi:hypothetical protein